MTSTPTDRYVSATVSALDDAQRRDVERELRATIEDMGQARADAGEPPADAAVRRLARTARPAARGTARVARPGRSRRRTRQA